MATTAQTVTGAISHPPPPRRQPYDSRDAAFIGGALAAAAVCALAANLLHLPKLQPLTGVTHMTPQEAVAENLLLLQVEFLKRHLS